MSSCIIDVNFVFFLSVCESFQYYVYINERGLVGQSTDHWVKLSAPDENIMSGHYEN